jgi:NAD(P)-dependent dehydrogenase (short-subunit alcohol dehydrogenase family)
VNPLEGKVAIVTGSARGIGRAAAVALAEAGADLVGIDICAKVGLTLDSSPATTAELAAVNAVIPGLIDIALTRHEDRYAQVLQEAGREPSGDTVADEAAAHDIVQNKSPLGVPWIEPEDVAPSGALLASPAARMISGASFAATGGDSAHFTT